MPRHRTRAAALARGVEKGDAHDRSRGCEIQRVQPACHRGGRDDGLSRDATHRRLRRGGEQCERIARASFTAPGTNGAVFATFADPIINGIGEVAFRATLRSGIGDTVAGNTIALWSNSHGTLTVAARQGARPPGLANSVKLTAFNSYVLPDAGGVAKLATVAGSGITTANN